MTIGARISCVVVAWALLIAGCGKSRDSTAIPDADAPYRIEQMAAARAIASPPLCHGPLTGRDITVGEEVPGFGKVAGPGSGGLPLLANEYAITIDDGPTPATLPELLKILDEYCVKATFFLIGSKAEAHPELVQQILARGHRIGSHSWDHANFAGYSEEQIEDDMRRGADAVDLSAQRARPARRLIRIPGSSGFKWQMSPAFAAFLTREHFALAGYDASPEDWRNDDASVSFGRLISRLPDRGVILMHDWPSHTPLLLRMVLERLKARGAHMVVINAVKSPDNSASAPLKTGRRDG